MNSKRFLIASAVANFATIAVSNFVNRLIQNMVLSSITALGLILGAALIQILSLVLLGVALHQIKREGRLNSTLFLGGVVMILGTLARILYPQNERWLGALSDLSAVAGGYSIYFGFALILFTSWKQRKS